VVVEHLHRPGICKRRRRLSSGRTIRLIIKRPVTTISAIRMGNPSHKARQRERERLHPVPVFSSKSFSLDHLSISVRIRLPPKISTALSTSSHFPLLTFRMSSSSSLVSCRVSAYCIFVVLVRLPASHPHPTLNRTITHFWLVLFFVTERPKEKKKIQKVFGPRTFPSQSFGSQTYACTSFFSLPFPYYPSMMELIIPALVIVSNWTGRIPSSHNNPKKLTTPFPSWGYPTGSPLFASRTRSRLIFSPFPSIFSPHE